MLTYLLADTLSSLFSFARFKMVVNYNFVINKFVEKDRQNLYWKNKLTDLFWPIASWPKHLAVNLFKCKYKDRISIVSFLFMNELCKDDAIELIKFYNTASNIGTPWEYRERELRSVWHRCHFILHRGSIEQKRCYFYYSMIERRVFNYAGEIKLHNCVAPSKSGYYSFSAYNLLQEDEHLEKRASLIADAAEKEYEQRVLNEILAEIRQKLILLHLYSLILLFKILILN